MEYYVVEVLGESYHRCPDDTNEHQLGLPIVDGPYESRESAPQTDDAYTVVPVPEGYVPTDWNTDD